MNYYSITFQISENWQQEIVIAQLDAIGFEGFELTEKELIAFIATGDYSEDEFLAAITPLREEYGFTFNLTEVAGQNWNEAWEKSFQPIIINHDIAVRASFHPPFPGVKYDIIIDPKMSFGTGHHATTSMMMQLMLLEDFNGKKVLDFGSGTGILSVLAAKLHAASILAIDHEEWACNNAVENFGLNKVLMANVVRGDAALFQTEQFDLILANINLTIITGTMLQFKSALLNGGKLLISGFLESDEKAVIESAREAGFSVGNKLLQEGWLAMSLYCE